MVRARLEGRDHTADRFGKEQADRLLQQHRTEVEFQFEVDHGAVNVWQERPATDQSAKRTLGSRGVDTRTAWMVGCEFDPGNELLVEWPEADRKLRNFDVAVALAHPGGMAPRKELGISSNIGHKVEQLHRLMTDKTTLGVTG